MTTQYHFSQSTFSQKFPNNDTFKFMVSTDTHLGYKESHPIRKNDSFEAFEEVLRKAKENNVDFLLLGGDLFHELNPSQESLYKCLSILKDKIFGDKQIEYQTFWEDQAPNYSNENMNISLPIFIIHGNHDYPSNEYGNLSTLDLLHAGNYLNYFGKFVNNEQIEVKPIIFHKKDTKIALYGLGHIKDVRLHYMLQNDKIKFTQPEENPENYFHILIIHQNRFKGMKNWGYKNSIHAKMFPNFFNLIIWAHEHESLPDIEQSSEIQAYIYQPGSSVATSLIEAETKTKHAGLFTFRKNEFYFEPIYLTDSERILVYKQIELGSFLKKKGDLGFDETNEEVEKYLEGEIEGILKELEGKSQKKEKEKLPLVRLKIEYSGFDIIRIQRLEAKFIGKIANGGEILKFWKKKMEFDEKTIEKNANLTTKFTECFRNKNSFNTLGNESITDIRMMFEDDLKKNSFKILKPDVFLEKVDSITFRNRQTMLSDFLDTGLNKINKEIFQNEKENISRILTEFDKKADFQLNFIAKCLKNPKISKENRDENPFLKKNFEVEINNFIENLKKKVISLSSTHINTVLKPETPVFEENQAKETILEKERPSKQRKKNRKSIEKTDNFDEDIDKKSVSTNISQNLGFEKKFQMKDEDFSDEKEEEYKINVLKVEKSEEKQKTSTKILQNKQQKPKKNKGNSMQEKKKITKEEKFEENKSQKAFLDNYLNPKKRKAEEILVKKPEKPEKKEEKVMNAEAFLGALLEKKSEGSFQKQRVFGNSPLVSKSKEKPKDFF